MSSPTRSAEIPLRSHPQAHPVPGGPAGRSSGRSFGSVLGSTLGSSRGHGGGPSWLTLLLWLFCLFFIVLPLGTVVVIGVGSGRLPELAAADVVRATVNSLVSSLTSGLAAVALATVLVVLIEHTELPGRRVLRVLALSPLLVPPFIGAISWSGVFGPMSPLNRAAAEVLDRPLWNIYGGDGVIFLLTVHSYPVAYLIIAAAAARVPADMEQAARVSGAGTRRVLGDVTLPLIRPALLSAFVLTAVSNLADFGIPALIGTPERYETLATLAYRYVQSGTVERPLQLVACIGVLLLLLVAAGLFAMQRTGRRADLEAGESASAPAPLSLAAPWLVSPVVWLVVLGLTVLPLAALLQQALIPAPGVPLSLETVTLANFERVLESPWTVDGARTSITLAAGAALITGTAGLLIGTLATRARTPGSGPLRQIALLPQAVPGIIVAVGWLILAPSLGLFNSPWLILCAYVMAFLALVVQAVEAPLRSTPAALEEAARISGAGALRSFVDVSMRMALPAARAGAILVLLTAVRELTISALLLAPNVQTLGVVIFNLQQSGAYGTAAALSVIVTVVGLCGMGLATRGLRHG
ncbi:ABC transporter permease [Sediminivirga luteola]|uniref:ABC transporter permease n=1 Tax=Sediminivirga luteola TaxID=1774748 RepID=UPI0016673A70|nr:iron ABC transporter permease [Sediminivirga luteola]MCI2266268.1 iron ABC transporter permease [Sediminivirga luteola]